MKDYTDEIKAIVFLIMLGGFSAEFVAWITRNELYRSIIYCFTATAVLIILILMRIDPRAGKDIDCGR